AWLDQQKLRWFAGLNTGLHDTLDDAQARVQLRGNVELLHALAGSIAQLALVQCPPLDVSALRNAAESRERLPLFDQHYEGAGDFRSRPSRRSRRSLAH